ASAPALVPHEIAGCGHRRRHRLGRLGTKPAEDLVEPVLLLRRLGCTLHRHRRRLNRGDALDDGFLARLASLFLLLPDDVFFFGPLHHVEGRRQWLGLIEIVMPEPLHLVIWSLEEGIRHRKRFTLKRASMVWISARFSL